MDIIRFFNDSDNKYQIRIRGDIEEPLFNAVDIENILGLTNINSKIYDYDENKKKILDTQTSKGIQKNSYLSIDGIEELLSNSRKKNSIPLRKWVFSTIVDLCKNNSGNSTINSEYEKLQKDLASEILKNKKLSEELAMLEKSSTTPSMYVYDTGNKNDKGINILKIGYTKNVHNRIKPYKTTNPYGKLQLNIPINVEDIKKTEHFYHHIFKNFRSNNSDFGECYEISLEKAINSLTLYCNMIDLIQNADKKGDNIKKIIDMITKEEKGYDPQLSTNTLSTQTDYVYSEPSSGMEHLKQKIGIENYDSFTQFISTQCLIHPEATVSCKAIEGAYRIWSRRAEKENYHFFKEYMSFREFKLLRIKSTCGIGGNNGYEGIMLKEKKIIRSPNPTEIEIFLWEHCNFIPEGKILLSQLLDEYKKWKENLKSPCLVDYEKKFKEYLNDCEYVIQSTIWGKNNSGNGYGYYGIQLKKDEKIITHSSTGKKIEKVDVVSGQIIKQYDTIASAAVEEKMPPCNISRAVKNKRIFGSDQKYYYRILVKE